MPAKIDTQVQVKPLMTSSVVDASKVSVHAPKVATSSRCHCTLATSTLVSRHATVKYVELCIPLVIINVRLM